MAAADLYPGRMLPSLPQLQLPLRNLALGGIFAAIGIWLVGLLLPRTPAYHKLVSTGASGSATDLAREREQAAHIGLEGVTVSVLRPGGKAAFGDRILDVIAVGEMLPRGTRVRIIGHSAHEAIVEPVPPTAGGGQD